VQDALPIVIVAVVVLAGLVAVGMLFASAGAYDHIGRSGMSFDRDAPAPANDPFRDEDTAQLLEATNARRAAHGLSPLSLAAFERPPDSALRAEVRAFVEARNERRVARGLAPLDVDAEVERRLWSQDG
jgi:nitroreductase